MFINVKRPPLLNGLNEKCKIDNHGVHNYFKSTLSQLLSYNFCLGTDFGIVSDLEFTIVYKLMETHIAEPSSESDIPDLQLVYSKIRNCRFGDDQIFSYNRLQTRLLVMTQIFKFNKDKISPKTSKLARIYKDVMASPEELSERDKKELKNIELQSFLEEEERSTSNDTTITDFSYLQGMLETNSIPSDPESPSKGSRLLRFTELPSNFNGLTPVRTISRKGEFLTEIFTISSKDFLKYFNPNSREINEIKHDTHLVINLYNDTTIGEYYMKNRRKLRENKSFGYESEVNFKKHVINQYFKTELIANLRIRAHNETFMKRKSKKILSPRLIKFGTLYQSYNMKGYYLVFEKVEPVRSLVREHDLKNAVKQVKILHSINIAHQDLHPRNMLVNSAGEIQVLDFNSAEIFNDARFLFSEDFIQLENTFQKL